MAMMSSNDEIGMIDLADEATREPRFREGDTPYSKELEDIVRSCTRYDPANRPTFDDLRKQIESCTDKDGLNLARDMRASSATDRRGHAESLRYDSDTLGLGLQWARDSG